MRQEERAARLQAAIRAKEAQLAARRAARLAGPSARQIRIVAAVALAAAALAWPAGDPAESAAALKAFAPAAVDLLQPLLSALAGLEFLLLGIAIGCLLAGFRQIAAYRERTAAAASDTRAAALMLWLSLLFLGLNVAPALF